MVEIEQHKRENPIQLTEKNQDEYQPQPFIRFAQTDSLNYIWKGRSNAKPLPFPNVKKHFKRTNIDSGILVIEESLSTCTMTCGQA